MSASKPTFTGLALASVGHHVGMDGASTPEAAFLAEHSTKCSLKALPELFAQVLKKPSSCDQRLAELAIECDFSEAEVLSIALACAVEEDVMVGRALAYAQAPLGGSRPTLGLLSTCFGWLNPRHRGPAGIVAGRAFQAGVLISLHEDAPLSERPVSVPMALCLALSGQDSIWPGGRMGELKPELLPASVKAASHRHAEGLARPNSPVLVIRSGHFEETQAVAAEIAVALKLHPYLCESVSSSGFGAWLRLRRILPIFLLDSAPGETKVLPHAPLYDGPFLVAGGLDGAIEAPGREVINWTLPIPSEAERALLWQEVLSDEAAAAELAATHRQSAARIRQLGRLARHRASISDQSLSTAEVVRIVSRSGEGSGLASLAQPLTEAIQDDALVLTVETRSELEGLVARCRHRGGLTEGLGPSAAARYTPGVRALFIGPSGTGKTLAACWLATRLGLPLFRVDLSAITSKYIGETEKNLARLLARAECTEAMLLFDEADSLFGKRTDVRESNDRFANAQTNYLLQRIETFDGIALLTSNSRGRFDSAFSRRLDMIIDFPLPGPRERRELWLSHLGPSHQLTMQDINLVAGQCDFPGGQIRNVVLAAAVTAKETDEPLDLRKIIHALAAEYKKSGRNLPQPLASAREAAA